MVFVGLLLIAMSRSPYLLLHGRFFAEEGSVYFTHMKQGSIWFVSHPVGYVFAFCNIATWLAAHVALEHAPLVTVWLSFGVIALLVWAALWLPSELLPNAGSRIAAATLLVVGPLAVPQVWLNSTNAQTYLGILAVLLLFVDVNSLRRTGFAAIGAMLLLAGLSGLYAAALAPLFLLRAFQAPTRRRILLACAISLCALAQIVVVQRSHATGDLAQGRGSFRGLQVITRDVTTWHFGTLIFGNSLAIRLHRHAFTFLGLLAFIIFAAVIAGLLASVLAVVPRRRVALYLVAAFAIEEFLIIFGTLRAVGGRYVVVPIAIMLLMAVHAMTTARPRWAVRLSSALCAVAFVSGCSVFWTGEPSTLRCIKCPEWQHQVRTWRAGHTDRLLIWPYTGRIQLTVHLPHHHPASATDRTTRPVPNPATPTKARYPVVALAIPARRRGGPRRRAIGQSVRVRDCKQYPRVAGRTRASDPAFGDTRTSRLCRAWDRSRCAPKHGFAVRGSPSCSRVRPGPPRGATGRAPT